MLQTEVCACVPSLVQQLLLKGKSVEMRSTGVFLTLLLFVQVSPAPGCLEPRAQCGVLLTPPGWKRPRGFGTMS